jgi:hypothetical protein
MWIDHENFQAELQKSIKAVPQPLGRMRPSNQASDDTDI